MTEVRDFLAQIALKLGKQKEETEPLAQMYIFFIYKG